MKADTLERDGLGNSNDMLELAPATTSSALDSLLNEEDAVINNSPIGTNSRFSVCLTVLLSVTSLWIIVIQ